MRCPHPWKTLFVTITGDAYPCCFNTKQKSFGNIKTDSLADIWNGAAFAELRRAWVEGGWGKLGCAGCRLLELSGGDIPYGPVDLEGPGGRALGNERLNFGEFQQGRSVLESLPVSLTYFPSTHCNLACVFCGQNTSGVLDLGDTGFALLEALTPSLRSITWLGGEPVIQPQLGRWVEALERYANPELKVGLITNASFYAEKLLDRAALFEHVSVNISFDAHEPALYEELRRKASFPKVLANIDRYLDLRARSENFSVNVNCLWQKRNFSLLPDYLRFCRERKLFALVNPLDYWPVPMRLDFFADLEQDLPAEREALLDEALAEARALDRALAAEPKAALADFSMGMPSRVEDYVALSAGLCRAGMARHKGLAELWEADFSPACAGMYVFVHGPGGEVISYAAVDAAGHLRLRLPKGARGVASLAGDCYGTPARLRARDLVPLSRGKRLAVWGTGQAYRDLVAPLHQSGRLGEGLRFFVDSNPDRQGATLDGRPVLPPEALASGEAEALCVLSYLSDEIIAQAKLLNHTAVLFVAAVEPDEAPGGEPGRAARA